MFDETTASSLVKVDPEGRQVLDSPHAINPAGFNIQSAIRPARADAVCVLHVHSINGVAVAVQEVGVLPLSQHSIFVAMDFFETSCRIQVRAQSGGQPLRRIGETILTDAQTQWEQVTRSAGGGLAWSALLHRLDRLDPSYHD